MEVAPICHDIFPSRMELKIMSYAVVRMQKMKSHDLKGIQFHNQRERDSQTNDDIDKSKSHENYDLVNDEKIDYNERVKNIIDSQKTGTRKTRKDAVLVNELLVTSDRQFFEGLEPAEQRRFFEESYKILAERYGEQNMAYAMVHNDEKTPHLHVGVVPMRDRKLQGKNVFNRQELLWLQEEFPKRMSRLGFDLVRGEKGSDREHMETAKFKKHTLEKENAVLEKDIADKKNELLALNKKVPDEIKIQTKTQMRTVEVPTGEKNFLGQEKTKKEKQPTGNRIVAEEEFQKMMTAAKENQRLKTMLDSYLTTDIVKKNKQLEQENEHLKSVIDEYYDEWQDLTKENRELKNENSELKAHIGDLTNEIKILYQTTKEYFKARTSYFKGALREFADKLKDKLPKSQFGRLQDTDERQEKENQYSINALKQMEQEIKRQNAMKKKNKKKSHDMEL